MSPNVRVNWLYESADEPESSDSGSYSWPEFVADLPQVAALLTGKAGETVVIIRDLQRSTYDVVDVD